MRLAHLLAVAAQHDPVRHTGCERRPVKQRGGQHVQGVKPAASLPDVLDDEVAGIVGVEPLAVLERIVHLCVRHGAGIEPHIENIRDAPHRRTPGRVVRVGSGELVDVGPVQIVGPHAEVTLELVEAAVDVDPRIGRVVGDPHRNRGAPIAISRD